MRVATLNNVIAQGMNPKKKHEVGHICQPFCSSYILISFLELFLFIMCVKLLVDSLHNLFIESDLKLLINSDGLSFTLVDGYLATRSQVSF